MNLYIIPFGRNCLMFEYRNNYVCGIINSIAVSAGMLDGLMGVRKI